VHDGPGDAPSVKWVQMICSIGSTVRISSPRDLRFTALVLEPLAIRHSAGESSDELSAELYHVVHPWAVSFAKSQSSGLPAHADRNEVLSQVLRLTWDACLRIDWSRCDTWTTFLDTKVGRARAEAARSDDWLSRQERVRRRWFQGETARREQVEQRTLTGDERLAVANTLTPGSGRPDWAQSLLTSRHPSSVADVPDVACGPTDDSITTEDQVEGQELGGIRVRCLAAWMTIVAEQNQQLAEDLSHWSELNDTADRDLPARLAHRLEPYTCLLLTMLGDAA
jgi:hypothetical protein